MSLSRNEQETHISQTAEDRIAGHWYIYSDDPVHMRRLDEIAEFVREEGQGKHYRLQNNQVRLYRKPSALTDEQVEQRRAALKKARESLESVQS